MVEKKDEKGTLITGVDRIKAKLEALSGEQFDGSKKSDLGRKLTAKARPIGRGAAVIALDCSGSMSGKCFSEAKKGAKGFVDEAFSAGYRVGVVGFGTNAWLQSEISDDREKLKVAIDVMELSGLTDMAGGIEVAQEMLAKNKSENMTIFIMTDGMPDDQEATLHMAELAKIGNCSIMCQGTEGADHAFLKSLASSEELAQMSVPKDLPKSMSDMGKRLALSHQDKRALPMPKPKK